MNKLLYDNQHSFLNCKENVILLKFLSQGKKEF